MGESDSHLTFFFVFSSTNKLVSIHFKYVNYNENKHRSEEANEIDDFELDVRFGREDNCPQGYHKEGDVCFPND